MIYPIWFFILIYSCSSLEIRIIDGIVSEGQEAYRIETPGATYIYQKSAGGFSSIMDPNGIDWVQFHKSEDPSYPASAAADYRGLPNLVFQSDDGGCGHPGFEKMESEILSPTQIRSTSKSGKWQWVWTFYETHAEMQLLQTDDSTAYWFLYEGPVAGKFSPNTHYWGNEKNGPSEDTPDLVLGPELYDNWQIAYFGDESNDHVFFLHQKSNDEISDLFTYMGNTEMGNASKDGMVVFGFGRAPGATPLLKGPNKLLIGFYPDQISTRQEHLKLIDHIKNLN